MLELPPTFSGSLPAAPLSHEARLRKRYDRALGRAVVDRRYAEILLDDPTEPIGSTSIPSTEYPELQNIRAASLQDFAWQLSAAFGPSEAHRAQPDSAGTAVRLTALRL